MWFIGVEVEQEASAPPLVSFFDLDKRNFVEGLYHKRGCFHLALSSGLFLFSRGKTLGARLALNWMSSLNLYTIEQTATSLQGSRFVIRAKE